MKTTAEIEKLFDEKFPVVCDGSGDFSEPKYIDKELKRFLLSTLDERDKAWKESYKYTAWCDCGDALEAIPLKNDEGMIITYEYECFGCQKRFVLSSLNSITKV